MRMTLLAAAVAGFALAAAGTARPGNPVLVGKVGYHNAFKIALRFPNGQLVRTLPAGTYTIVVHDYSRLHNFALGSQTDNRRIFTGSIRGIGTKTYTVTFTPGSYAYACSAHFRTMNGTFVVTAPSDTTTGETTTGG
jgi:plastocyanin